MKTLNDLKVLLDVCDLPENDLKRTYINRLIVAIEKNGGKGFDAHVSLLAPKNETLRYDILIDAIDAFNWQVSDEYHATLAPYGCEYDSNGNPKFHFSIIVKKATPKHVKEYDSNG